MGEGKSRRQSIELRYRVSGGAKVGQEEAATALIGGLEAAGATALCDYFLFATRANSAFHFVGLRHACLTLARAKMGVTVPRLGDKRCSGRGWRERETIMGHFIRLLTPSTAIPSLAELQDALSDLGYEGVSFAVEETGEDETDAWSFLRVYGAEGTPLCDVTRDERGVGDIVEEELADFHAELKDAKPKNAARWVKEQLDKVKAIYALQILIAAPDDEDESDDEASEANIPNVLLALFQGYLGGVIQGDGEGFSNEDGALVISQFAADDEGEWTAAVLGADGSWTTFLLNLGDPSHRAAFEEGKAPPGAVLITDDDDETLQ